MGPACAGARGPLRAGSWLSLVRPWVLRSLGLGHRLDRVAAELVAERRRDLGGEVDLVARCEAREERSRDDGCRDVLCDRLVDRPAAFARVLDVRSDVVELVAVLLERGVQQ